MEKIWRKNGINMEMNRIWIGKIDRFALLGWITGGQGVLSAEAAGADIATAA